MSLTAASRLRVNLQKDTTAKGDPHPPKTKKLIQPCPTQTALAQHPTAPSLPAKRKLATTQISRQAPT